MPDWPVGLSTGCFYHQNILSCLDTIKHGGFDLIEVCSVLTHLDYYDVIAVRRANDRIRELELKAHSFHTPFAQHIDISSPSDSVRKNAVAEVLMAAEAAALLEVDNRSHSDEHLPPGDGSIDWMQLVSGLRTAHFNGAVILEIANSGDNGEMMTRAERGRQFLQQLLQSTDLPYGFAKSA
jgi:sugar phosphate isomerase/epimerase